MDTISRIILQGVDNTSSATKTAKQNMASLGDQATVSAKQTAAAMRMVPAQLTDIVTQLAGGQSPFLILIQQGGQLKDMFGGVGNAAKAMGNYLLGIVSPGAIIAAGLGAVAFAALQGSKESAEFNKQLALTGGYAGLSASQLMVMAAKLGEANGTQHEAASVLAAIVASGQVAGGQFEAIGNAALAMSDATGRAVKDIVEEFVELGKAPAAASAKLNEQYHYLTLSVYEQIKALEDQGRKTDAAALAQGTYAAAMKASADQVSGQLGMLERSWKSITETAKKAWDAMLNVGRNQTTGEQLATLEKTLADRVSRGPLNSTSTDAFERGNAALRQQIEFQREALRMDNRAANAKGTDARVQAAGITAQIDVSKLEDQARGLSRVNRELEEYHQKLDAIRKADPNSASLDPATIKRTEASIRKRAAGAAPSRNEYAINTELVDLQGGMQEVERAVKASLESIKTDYDIGLIGTREYIDKDFAIRQDGLENQLAIAQKLEEVAEGKKNTAAAERYKNEIQKIEDEIESGAQKHGDDIKRYDAQVNRATTEYLAGLNAEYSTRQQAIDDLISGATLGAIAQEQLQRITNLTREFNKRKEELRKASQAPEANGGISQEKYQKELADLQSSYDQRVSLEQGYNSQSAMLRSDWRTGNAKALADYQESSLDVASQSQRAWGGLYSGLEDAAVAWASGSKVSISSVGTAFASELLRMEIRARASSVYSSVTGGKGLFSGFFGSSSGGTSIADATAADVAGAGDGLMFLADGGYTGDGGKYDVAGFVHRGEYVLNAKATARIGRPKLDALNGFADGGYVGAANTVAMASGGGVVINLNVKSFISGNAQVETQQRQNADGSFDFDVILRDFKSEIGDDVVNGTGPIYQSMRARFGLADAMG